MATFLVYTFRLRMIRGVGTASELRQIEHGVTLIVRRLALNTPRAPGAGA